MSLLGIMIVQIITHDDHLSYQYSFVDFVVRGYESQDVLQLSKVLEIMVNRIKKLNPSIKEICLQSDNASCFSSQDYIPFIHILNKELSGIKVVKWIFTEAQTGRGRLDTHFSYINIMLRPYVEDGFNIDIEEDIYKALKIGEVLQDHLLF